MRYPILTLGLMACLALDRSVAFSTTVTFTPIKDNTLCQDLAGATSNGAGTHLFVGRNNQPFLRRALVAFDLTAQIPAGATINTVTLTLNMSRTQAGPENIELHRVTFDWGEGLSDAGANEGKCATAVAPDATWLHRMTPASTWAAAGGDFVVAPSATLSVGAVGTYTWASTAAMVADAQMWLDQPASSFGWILIGNEAVDQTTKRFDSRESLASGPKLTVDYTVVSQQAVLYGSLQKDPCLIIAAGNSVGTGANQVDFTPAAGSPLFYQVDSDVDCATQGPALLHMIKFAPGIRASF